MKNILKKWLGIIEIETTIEDKILGEKEEKKERVGMWDLFFGFRGFYSCNKSHRRQLEELRRDTDLILDNMKMEVEHVEEDKYVLKKNKSKK